MSRPVLIGIDWGTSSFRAFLIDEAGLVLDRIASADGILAVPAGGFEATFVRLLGPWLEAHPDLPILASGMVGSRQGWREVPYAPCPVSPAALAAALVPLETACGRRVHLVPGLLCRDGDGLPDVLRGEEVQILGALEQAPASGCLCLPGTHGKWVRVRAGVVLGFATFMTGELFAVLKNHSILGRMAQGEAEDAAAFERGAAIGLVGEPGRGGTLRRLFFARTLALSGELAPGAVASFLSGLLIGCEVREALSLAEPEGPVLLVGEPGLCRLWARVLERAGAPHAIAPAELAALGQLRLAKQAGLVRDRSR
ncbi:MAG: 2-dehydro-3-deoxygalactonokinase [Geminicoccaceae bacterium]|nr:2-dehydro-3-deoxygalactonokinase [Geminicoccaceae bacterium]MCX8100540.1 2-dehydro-3-deoxygalactonokinase [Geminicoccaceae bacterium]MDW8369666.1 2-dehydro-3-deoxygalactonokinase [Geminicoccaceae bacterium]